MRTLTMNEVQDVDGGVIVGFFTNAIYDFAKGFANAVMNDCHGYANPSDVYTSGGWVG
jgi:hypothetical protein